MSSFKRRVVLRREGRKKSKEMTIIL